MKTPAFLDPVMNALRGETKSIRYRFFVLPREWLTLALYRLTGRTYIDFYKQRLDGFAVDQINTPSPPEYIEEAKLHFDFLMRHGLEPTDRFLDYGCGILRLALQVVPFLQPDKYVGLEISNMRVLKGLGLLREAGISADRYEIVLTNDCELRELGGRQFDVVWAKSVFTHLPEAEITTMLRSLRNRLSARGVFYFTFMRAERVKRSKMKDFYYPEQYIRGICEDCGYSFTIAEDWPVEQFGDVMAEIRPR